MAKGKVTERDTGWRALKKQLRGIDGMRVKVGVQGKEAAEEHPEAGFTMARLWEIHEFGEPRLRIPERSVIRRIADENRVRYENALVGIAERIVRGPQTVKGPKNLLGVGEAVRKDMMDLMRQGKVTPELSEVRKAQRGEEGPPLVDTGQMMNALRAVLK